MKLKHFVENCQILFFGWLSEQTHYISGKVLEQGLFYVLDYSKE